MPGAGSYRLARGARERNFEGNGQTRNRSNLSILRSPPDSDIRVETDSAIPTSGMAIDQRRRTGWQQLTRRTGPRFARLRNGQVAYDLLPDCLCAGSFVAAKLFGRKGVSARAASPVRIRFDQIPRA